MLHIGNILNCKSLIIIVVLNLSDWLPILSAVFTTNSCTKYGVKMWPIWCTRKSFISLCGIFLSLQARQPIGLLRFRELLRHM